MIEAYHLPALPHLPTTVWPYGRGAGAVEVRIPQLSPALLAEQVDALLEAREAHLADRPVAEIVEAIDAVAARLLDPADALRRSAETALPAVTGASPEMVRRVLDGMADGWRRPRLEALLRAELGDPELLDAFRPHPSGTGRLRALGPRLATHLFAGQVPGIDVGSLARTLLVKAGTLARTSPAEPLLAALFARGLAEVDGALGDCIAVAYWPAGDAVLDRLALDAAEVVLAFGSAEAVDSVRERAPAGARFLGHPPRISAGLVARESLDPAGADRLAEGAALDVALFDQQRSGSPHVFYLETGGRVEPRAWAARLASALGRLEAELPRGTIAPGEAGAIRQLRAAGEAARMAGEPVAIHGSAEVTGWTVIFDADPAFVPSCRNRVVRVHPVAALEEVPALLAPVAADLHGIGVAGPEARVAPLVESLARLGAARVSPVGAMAWPGSEWHPEGRPRLRSLLRWCTWE